jgi:ribonuclease P protein component
MTKFKALFSFSKKEVSYTFDNAFPVKSILGLKMLQTAEQHCDYGKMLIVASRKTGKAHDRNKVRRRLKEAFYTSKFYKKSVISIIIVYKKALDLSFDQLKTFLELCFNQ